MSRNFDTQKQITESIYRIKLVGANDYIECIVCKQGEIINFELGLYTEINRGFGNKKISKGNKAKKKFIEAFEIKHLKSCRGEEKKIYKGKSLAAQIWDEINKSI